jgi:transcriptional regulator with XRE-family HTH domain
MLRLGLESSKALRIGKEMTQSQVAEKAGLNVNYYAKVERAVLKPSPEVYESIAKALNVTFSQIFPF